MILREQALAVTLATFGILIFVLAVVLPRVTGFTLGAKGIEARLEQLEHKVDMLPTRTELARFVVEGDQLVLHIEHERQSLIRSEEDQQLPSADLSCIDDVIEWMTRMAAYIREAPELGEADALLFDTHGPDLSPTPPIANRLFDEFTKVVRNRQGRIRELIRRLE